MISVWRGAQIEDKVPLTALEKEQMFVDILPEEQEDDGIAYLSFFVEKRKNLLQYVEGNSIIRTEPDKLYKDTG